MLLIRDAGQLMLNHIQVVVLVLPINFLSAVTNRYSRVRPSASASGSGGDEGGGSSPSDQGFEPGGGGGVDRKKNQSRKKNHSTRTCRIFLTAKKKALLKRCTGIMTGYKFLNNQLNGY